MRSWVSLILCVVSASSAFAGSSADQRGTELAELHPQLVWQRVSPSPQKPDGPVLYQIQLTLGQPNTLPKYDNSGRHFTASRILDNGTTVAIGGFSVNGTSGIITFASGQTFPASGFPAPGGDVSGTFSSLKVTGLQGVGVSSALPTNGQVLRFNGSTWAPATLAASSGGTVTSITAGSGLAASPANPITTTGTLSIGNAAVTNAMLVNPALTVSAGTGLSGGGAVALGGTTTLSIGAGAVTNALLQNSSVTISSGSGLSGGGAVALGNTITLSNTGLLSLGASAPIASTGGQNPTLSLNIVDVAHGGTGIGSSGVAGNFLRSNGTAWVASPIQAADLPTLSSTYVDLTSNQSIGGNKTFTGIETFNNLIAGNISGNAATATTATTATTANNALALGGNGAAAYSTTAQNDTRYLQLSGGTLTGGLNGTTGTFIGAVSAGSLQLPATATATSVSGANSGVESLAASVFNSSNSTAQNQTFLWQAEPAAGTNNTAAPSGTLSLLFSGTSNAFTPTETGLSLAPTGIIKFAAGQTFPGAGGGSVTNVSATAPLTVTNPSTTPNISIAAAGITNGLLANPSLTVSAGSGLTGGGTVALGGTTTLSVGTGAVTNAMLANPSVTINTGSGLSGGGALALGGSLSLANTGLLSLGVSAPILSTGGQNPSLSLGTVQIANGGTGITTAPTAGQFLRSAVTGAWSVGAIQAGDLPSLSGTYVDLTTNQSVGGNKTFTGNATFNNLITGSISGNAATATSAAMATNALSLGGNLAAAFSTTAQSDARYLQLNGGTMTGSINFAGGQTFPNVLPLTGGTLTGPLSGTSANFSSTGNFGGTLTQSGGSLLPATGTATAANGFSSNANDLVASAFNTTGGVDAAQNQIFRWEAEPVNNNQTSASGSLNLLFGSGASAPAETGLSIASNGKITFASGQLFPGAVTNVGTGAGLTGGPITGSGTISVANGGITNTMLANPSLTVTAGSGLSGGGAVALGSSTTLSLLTSCASGQILKWNGSAWACAADANSGGTVTSIASGAGLTGGPISTTGTLSIATGGVTNTMLANPSLTVTAGPGLTGGGSVSLGNATTLNLDTAFTDNRYAAFSGNTNYIQNLSGGTQPGASFNVSGNGAVGGTFSLPPTGTATSGGGFNSANSDWSASAFNSTAGAAQKQTFRWIAVPVGNNTASPSGKFDLLFGSNGATPAETGLSIASNGQLTFASGQLFPGVLSLGGGTMTGNITFAGTQTFPGSVTVVNASLPLNSSGGSTPTISLTGIVPITNGGTGISSGPTVTPSGIVPAQFLRGSSPGNWSVGTIQVSDVPALPYLSLSGGEVTGGLTVDGNASFGANVNFSANTLLNFAGGAQYPATGNASAGNPGGFPSNSEEFFASTWNGTTAQSQRFHWEADPINSNSPSPTGALTLSTATGTGSLTATGLSIASNGQLTFAPGQTFPGTVTSVSGTSPITVANGSTTPNISIAASGITNALLAGGIDPAKITGTAATLGGANVFTNNQTLTNGQLTVTGPFPDNGGAFFTASPIIGHNTDTAGSQAEQGVLGIVDSPQGNGVTGFATATSGAGFGVLGETNSTGTGVGVYGVDTPSTGTGFGVEGVSGSPNGVAGVFYNSNGGDIVRGYNSTGLPANIVFKVDNNGNVFSSGTGANTIVLPNEATVGTFDNGLAKLTADNPVKAEATILGDTGGAIGIVVSGGGQSGNATIVVAGRANCAFDQPVTAGDYVGISRAFNADCVDIGATLPAGQQVVGRALAGGTGGTYPIVLFGPEQRHPAAIIGGFCSGTATTSSFLFGLGAMQTSCNSGLIPVATSLMSSAGTVANLQAMAGTGGVGPSSGVVTVYKNGSPTSVTCTLGTGTSCGDTSHSLPVNAGDRIGIVISSTGGGETLADLQASVEKF